uniref:Uncharacterized protein n=1 Tax=Siphoviridae sp. ctitf6 TaxID=2825627 RepID=A0A8S5P2J8_9CAUD|nr:MAG TPA: hypothetical protein [Siphoviridae sp. ctitf6]
MLQYTRSQRHTGRRLLPPFQPGVTAWLGNSEHLPGRKEA